MDYKEKVIALLNSQELSKEQKEKLENIFPELKESDDERIRKALIQLVNKSHEQGGYALHKDEAEEMIAYLEKQGEYANFRNKIQIGDKVTMNRDGVLVNLSQLNRVAKKDEKQGENFPILSNSSNIGKQGEQKPVPDWMPKFLDELRSKKNYFGWDEHKDFEGGIVAIINWMNPNYFNEKDGKQKPAEQNVDNRKLCNIIIEELSKYSGNEVCKAPWALDSTGVQYPLYFAELGAKWQKEQKPTWSVEDEKQARQIERIVHDDGCTQKLQKQIADWLKSLKGRVQSNQEWSEEDDNCLSTIIAEFSKCSGKSVSKDEWMRCNDFLNSLKPRHTWRPSEEQMDAVYSASLHISWGAKNCRILQSLYTDLKQL